MKFGIIFQGKEARNLKKSPNYQLKSSSGTFGVSLQSQFVATWADLAVLTAVLSIGPLEVEPVFM